MLYLIYTHIVLLNKMAAQVLDCRKKSAQIRKAAIKRQ